MGNTKINFNEINFVRTNVVITIKISIKSDQSILASLNVGPKLIMFGIDLYVIESS